jgi:hypothetical protein
MDSFVLLVIPWAILAFDCLALELTADYLLNSLVNNLGTNLQVVVFFSPLLVLTHFAHPCEKVSVRHHCSDKN